jgi:hypothetical protein
LIVQAVAESEGAMKIVAHTLHTVGEAAEKSEATS